MSFLVLRLTTSTQSNAALLLALRVLQAHPYKFKKIQPQKGDADLKIHQNTMMHVGTYLPALEARRWGGIS